jgi:hypothetical protein
MGHPHPCLTARTFLDHKTLNVRNQEVQENQMASSADHATAHAKVCQNCGTALVGTFCHGCGQHGHVHRSVLHVVEEFFHGITHFDGRAWRSLPMLMFRPGTLTRSYVMGQRARFVPPFAMFLFSVFAMFLVFAISGGPNVVRVNNTAAATSGDGAELGAQVKEALQKGDFIQSSNPALDEKIRAKTKNPDLLFYKLQNTAYKFSFLLVPLSLPFLWLMLFWKRGVTLFDHTVFALYSLSFVSFLFIALSLVGHIYPADELVGYVFMLIPVHMFFQFKGAYQLAWFSALWRTLLFTFLFSWIILAGFILAIVGLGVL